MRPGLIHIVALTVAALAAGPAAANCGNRDSFFAHLQERWGERLLEGCTIRRGGRRLEFLASERGTWTLLESRGDRACIVASGVNWSGGCLFAWRET